MAGMKKGKIITETYSTAAARFQACLQTVQIHNNKSMRSIKQYENIIINTHSTITVLTKMTTYTPYMANA